MKERPSGRASARGLRVALVRSAFNPAVVEGLCAGAREAFAADAGRGADLTEIVVPGAFELPLACRAAAASGRFDAVVALGAVIKGETDHYEHVATQAAAGLLRAGLDSGVPVGFGVLTVEREEQALARAAPGPDNKGAEAVRAAVTMVHVLRSLRRRGARSRRRG